MKIRVATKFSADVASSTRRSILSLVDDDLQLQVEFPCSIWALVPVGHVPGVAAGTDYPLRKSVDTGYLGVLRHVVASGHYSVI